MGDADVVVFVSNTSGNKEIKTKQEYVRHILNIRKIEFTEVDISDPVNDDQKKMMREKAKAKEEQSVPMPPQIFHKDDYLGGYDEFLEANECDEVYEFLKLSPPKTTSEACVTLAEQQNTENGAE